MRRTIWLLAAVLLCVVALGSDSPKEYDDKTAVVIEGTWRLVELDGMAVTPNSSCVLTFRHGIYLCDNGDGDPLRATYRIDNSRNPPHLDKSFKNSSFKGKTMPCIYHIEGGTLKIANKVADNEWRRPCRFDEEGAVVGTYKRVK